LTVATVLGRLRERRVQHVRQTRIDAERRAAIDLRRRIEPRLRVADVLETLLRVLSCTFSCGSRQRLVCLRPSSPYDLRRLVNTHVSRPRPSTTAAGALPQSFADRCCNQSHARFSAGMRNFSHASRTLVLTDRFT
jgi:hypothetical protein